MRQNERDPLPSIRMENLTVARIHKVSKALRKGIRAVVLGIEGTETFLAENEVPQGWK